MELSQILNSQNIAAELDDKLLEKIKNQVMDRYNNDKTSREQKNWKLQKIMKLSLLHAEGKSEPWDKASNVIFPLIATANTQFASIAYTEILVNAIVKTQVIGKDDGQPTINNEGEEIKDEQTGKVIMQNVGAKQKRGDRVCEYLNWQVRYEMDNWEEDTDTLLNALPALGTMFRKTYYDVINDKVCSELIFPDKIVVHDKAKSDTAPITQLISLYESQIIERIRSGLFVEFSFDPEGDDNTFSNPEALDPDNDNSAPKSGLHQFLEQHCRYDLDEDGYSEPYIVTIHQSSETIVRMVARFREKDVKYNEEGEIRFIKPINFFTKYIFMPSPDGSYYGMGLGELLYNLNHTANSLINQLVDAGTLANLGGGFISKSLKIIGGENKFRPGEWKFVDNFGVDMERNLIPLPVPTPSQTLFVLLDFIIQAGKNLGMLQDAITGDQAANMAPGVAFQSAEQGMKHFRAIFKRVFLALSKEFKKIFELDSEYLTDKKYLKIIDEAVDRASVENDFRIDDFDIVPTADIDNLSSMQRLAKINAYRGLLADPAIAQFINGQEAVTDILELMRIPDRDKLIVTPEPKPDPLVEMEMVKQENETKKIQIQAILATRDLEKAKYEIEKMRADIDNVETKSLLNIAQAEAAEKGHQLREYEAILTDLRAREELAIRSREQEMAEKQQLIEQEAQNQQIEEAPSSEEEV
jgi:chaperonin GroES